jgi:hypothetical protein
MQSTEVRADRPNACAAEIFTSRDVSASKVGTMLKEGLKDCVPEFVQVL